MEDAQSYAEKINDKELQYRIKLVFEYGLQIPSLVQKIKDSCVRSDGGI